MITSDTQAPEHLLSTLTSAWTVTLLCVDRVSSLMSHWGRGGRIPCRAQITPHRPSPEVWIHCSPGGLSPATKTSTHLHTCCLPSAFSPESKAEPLQLFSGFPATARRLSLGIWNPVRGPGGWRPSVMGSAARMDTGLSHMIGSH